MPNLIALTADTIAEHQDLKEFLTSEPANISLLKKPIGERYNVKLALENDDHVEESELTIESICALYGKLSHIEALYREYQKNEKLMSVAEAIELALYNEHLDTIALLVSYLPKNEEKKVDFDVLIYLAIEKGDLDKLKSFEQYLTPQKLNELVRSHNYSYIRQAVLKGNIDILKHLEGHLSEEERHNAVKIDKYDPTGSETGDLKKSGFLDKDTEDTEVKKGRFLAIKLAVEHGHLDILKHLETHLTHDEISSMVSMSEFVESDEFNNFHIIKSIANEETIDQKKYRDIVCHLCKHLTDEQFTEVKTNTFVKICLYLEKQLTRPSNKVNSQPDVMESPFTVVPIPAIDEAAQANDSLIKLIETICNKEGFWQDKVRNPFKTLPDGVKAVKEIIEMNKNNPANCLNLIQEYCQKQHSAPSTHDLRID